MSVDLYAISLEQLEALEDITIPTFNADVAWKIGNQARSIAVEKYASKGVVIDISLASGQVLFHTTTSTKSATSDNDEWAKRKSKSVIRFGKSSFYVGSKLRQKKQTIEQVYFISSTEFTTHGGSVPIRVAGNDSVIGTLTISGLAQEEDHLLALEVLRSFA